MTTERTLVILKPDAVQRGICGEILARFEKTTLKIIGMKMVYPDEDIAARHYIDDEAWLQDVGTKAKAAYAKKGVEVTETEREIGMRIRNQLMHYISMSPCIVLCLEGHGAIAKVRALTGATSPLHAAPGTIRGDYTVDSYDLADASNRPLQNLIHASDAVETAEREIAVWFTPEELHPFKRVDEPLVYRTMPK